MAKKPNIAEKYLRGLTTEQLQRLIKSEGKQANNRIDQLKKTGVWKYNAVVQGKWDTLLAGGVNAPSMRQTENIIKNRGVLGTPKGHFSTRVKGLSRNALIQQYKQIRQFLSQETTVKGTREQIKKAKELTGVENEEEFSNFWDLVKRVETILNVPSDFALEVVKEMRADGMSDNDIISRALAMSAKYSTEHEEGNAFYDEAFEHFVRDSSGHIKYY